MLDENLLGVFSKIFVKYFFQKIVRNILRLNDVFFNFNGIYQLCVSLKAQPQPYDESSTLSIGKILSEIVHFHRPPYIQSCQIPSHCDNKFSTTSY